MKRILIVIAIGILIISILNGCSKKVEEKEEIVKHPFDITSGTWTGSVPRVAAVYASGYKVQFFKDGTYEMVFMDFVEKGTYKLSPFPDGTYKLQMNYKEDMNDPDFTWIYFYEYLGIVNFENSNDKWHIRGTLTVSEYDSNFPDRHENPEIRHFELSR